MARQARIRARSGCYHLTVRGIDKMDIFLEDFEREKFIELLTNQKKKDEFEIYAYCLMSNHIHLLIREGDEKISDTVKTLMGGYAQWFNKRYHRHGPLFEDRFASEVVESDAYLLDVVRYIHRNPVKAGMVRACDEYKWSSAVEYKHGVNGITDASIVMGMFSPFLEKAVVAYSEFMKQPDERLFLEVRDRDEEAVEAAQVWNMLQENDLSDEERLVRFLRMVDIPSRTAALITGYGRSVIRRVNVMLGKGRS